MFGEPITYGGQESVVYNMLSVLDLKNEFSVDLFTPYYSDNKNLINLIEANAGKIYSLGINFKTGDNRFRLSPAVNKFFDTLDKKYDTVHIHTGSFSTMLVYAMSARKHGINNIIVHAHNSSTSETLIYTVFRKVLSFFLKKYATSFVGCSSEAINWRWSSDISKGAQVVRSGIDINKYKFNNDYRNEIRSKYNIKDKFVIGHIARYTREKNHIFTIDIAKSLVQQNKDFVFMLIGDGAIKEKIKQIVEDEGLTQNVIMLPNSSDIYKCYSAFDVFVLPSLREGLPITSIEAQVSSLPTIISDRVTKECCISNETYFLDIENAKEWVDKILSIKTKMDSNSNFRTDINVDYKKYDRNYSFEAIAYLYRKSRGINE